MILAKLVTALDRNLRKFLRKGYRDGYLEANVRSGIALQIRALREKAGMSQGDFAENIGTKQSVVSRLEDPQYGRVSVNTLLRIAQARDVALLVRFVDYPQFLRVAADMSPSALCPDDIYQSLKPKERSSDQSPLVLGLSSSYSNSGVETYFLPALGGRKAPVAPRWESWMLPMGDQGRSSQLAIAGSR